MVEESRKRLEPIPSSPETPVSSDLDWALQSSQASSSTILEVLVHEYYASMYSLVNILLEDETKSKAVICEVIIMVLTRKDRIRWEFGVKSQLFKLIYKECQRYVSNYNKSFERFVDPREKSQHFSGLVMPPDEDIFIWRCVDNLPKYERLALIVFYIQELDIPELAEILSIKVEQAHDLLLAAREKLQTTVIGNNPTNITDDTQIAKSLNKRWPKRNFSKAELDEVVDDIQKQLDQKSQRMRFYKAIQQVALVSGVIVLVWGILWLTNFSEMMGDPDPIIIKTVVVTQVVHKLKPTDISLEAPTPIPNIQPLAITSTSQEILERMNAGRYLWDTLWVNGLIFQYGPDGYIGPPRVRRHQVWINQPHSSLVLTGSQDGQVNHAWYSVNGKVYEVNLETGQPMYYDFHGEQLPIYSTLESLIFPNLLRVGENELRVIGSGQIADHEAIIVDWIGSNGSTRFRLWIEVNTGIILRLLQFAHDSDTVTLEALITSIEVNKEFRDNALNRQSLSLNFIGDDNLEDVQNAEDTNQISPTVEPSPQRTPHPKVNPPQGFDPKESVLKINWYQPPVAGRLQPFFVHSRPPDDAGEEVAVDIFADGYYLGQVSINPWSVTCDRSPDGRFLAFVTLMGEQDEIIPILGWFDLFEVSDIHYPPIEIRPGWEITFSPDSQNIAFQGCIEQDCGIFILNIDTLEIEQIFSGVSESISWSKDGVHLAWIGAESGSFDTDVYIRNLDADELIYHNEFLLVQSEATDLKLFDELGIKFEKQRFGLETCSLPK